MSTNNKGNRKLLQPFTATQQQQIDAALEAHRRHSEKQRQLREASRDLTIALQKAVNAGVTRSRLAGVLGITWKSLNRRVESGPAWSLVDPPGR